MKHSEYIGILKDTLTKLVIKSATSLVFKKIPFLAWGPIGPLVSGIIEKFVIMLFNETEMVIFLKYTDFRISRQGKEFSEAAIRNFEIQRTGSEDEKRKSEEELISAFRNFIKLAN